MGPQGTFLIGSTLCRFFAPPAYHDLKSKLAQTLEDLVLARPQDFDSDCRPDSRQSILPVDLFIEYLLVPYVATRLIAEDMDVTFAAAIDIKNASHEFGDMFHWNIKNAEIVALDEWNTEQAEIQQQSAPPTPNTSNPIPDIRSLSPEALLSDDLPTVSTCTVATVTVTMGCVAQISPGHGHDEVGCPTSNRDR